MLHIKERYGDRKPDSWALLCTQPLKHPISSGFSYSLISKHVSPRQLIFWVPGLSSSPAVCLGCHNLKESKSKLILSPHPFSQHILFCILHYLRETFSDIKSCQYYLLITSWICLFLFVLTTIVSVSYTHLTLPTRGSKCRSRWSPYH